MAVVIAPAAEEGGAVLLRALLIPFAVLAGYFVAWGIVFCMDALVRFWFGTASGLIGWIPFAGRILTSPLNAIEKKLTSFLGGLEVHFENQMSTRWHTFALLMRQWANEIEARALMDWKMAKKLAFVYEHTAPFVLGAALAHWLKAQLAKLHGVTTVVIHTKTIVDHPAVGKIGGAIHAGTRVDAARLGHVIEWDLPRLRAKDRSFTDQIGRLWKAIRSRERIIATGAVGAVMLTLLRRLGLNWIRCDKVKALGKNACRMHPGFLESLLAGSVAILGTVSLVELAHSMLSVEDQLAHGVRFGFREFSHIATRSAEQQGFVVPG